MKLGARARLAAALACLAYLFGPSAALADGKSFFEPDVAKQAFVTIAGSIGGSFDLMGLRITPSEFVVDVIPRGASEPQSWLVSHKGLIGGALGIDYATRVNAGTAVSRIGPISDSRFPFQASALDIVPKLAIDALARARLDQPGRVTEMELRRLPAIVGEASKSPIWQIHVAGVDEDADFGAKPNGEITSSDLNHTHRAARLNLLDGGAEYDDFISRIRQETGKDWVFHRIEIEKKQINLEMQIASSQHAERQRFTASIGQIRSDPSFFGAPSLNSAAEDEPFNLVDVDFSLLQKVEQAALDKLGIAKGAVTRVAVSKPRRENGAWIEWKVDVKPSDAPIFYMPGRPKPAEGSATFNAQGDFLRADFPEGDPRRPNLLDPQQLKAAIGDIASQLGQHEPVIELNVGNEEIRIRAADPKAPEKLVFFEYRNGLVGRSLENAQGVAAMFGDGPDWRWDLALLTPEVLDRLPALSQRAMDARAKSGVQVVGIDFTKDKPFYPNRTLPLIEIKTEKDKDVESVAFELNGEPPNTAPLKSGIYVGGKNITDGGSKSDIDGCEYSDDWPSVVAACSRWLDSHPQDDPRDRAIEYFNRGNAHMNLKQWSDAIADYSKSLETDPTYQRPYTNRAYVYLSSGDAVHALADATKAIQIDPKKTFAYIVRAFAEENQNQWDAAIADFGIVIAQTNGDGRQYYNRGIAYYSGKGDLDRAIADFSAAIAKDPKLADALVYRGIAKRLKGDLPGAIADHTLALSVDAHSGSAYFNRGMEYYLGGSMPKALADLTQSVALAPTAPYAGLLLDVVATHSGLQSQLKDMSGKYDMGVWPAPAIRLLLSQLTLDALAVAVEDGAPSDKPRRVCEATFYSGVALSRAGKADDAAAKWREALATCPHPTPERSYAEVELKAAPGAKR